MMRIVPILFHRGTFGHKKPPCFVGIRLPQVKRQVTADKRLAAKSQRARPAPLRLGHPAVTPLLLPGDGSLRVAISSRTKWDVEFLPSSE
jgi:hypothetical protein